VSEGVESYVPLDT